MRNARSALSPNDVCSVKMIVLPFFLNINHFTTYHQECWIIHRKSYVIISWSLCFRLFIFEMSGILTILCGSNIRILDYYFHRLSLPLYSLLPQRIYSITKWKLISEKKWETRLKLWIRLSQKSPFSWKQAHNRLSYDFQSKLMTSK